MMENKTADIKNSKKQSPSVYSIVLNYNNYSDTIETIESVLSLEYDANSVILVENSSDKTIIQKIRTQFPDLTIIENKKNLGYAGGNNIGIQKAMESGADYIFLLNNDVILEKDVLNKCVSAMEESPDCGACQPIIVTYENEERVWSAGTATVFWISKIIPKRDKTPEKRDNTIPFWSCWMCHSLQKNGIRENGSF